MRHPKLSITAFSLPALTVPNPCSLLRPPGALAGGFHLLLRCPALSAAVKPPCQSPTAAPTPARSFAHRARSQAGSTYSCGARLCLRRSSRLANRRPLRQPLLAPSPTGRARRRCLSKSWSGDASHTKSALSQRGTAYLKIWHKYYKISSSKNFR